MLDASIQGPWPGPPHTPVSDLLVDQRPRPLADLALGMGLASEVMMGALPGVQDSNGVSLRHGPPH